MRRLKNTSGTFSLTPPLARGPPTLPPKSVDHLITDPPYSEVTHATAAAERDEKYARVATERLEAEVRGLSLRDARAGQTSIFDTLGAP